jgi:hypothetical protein
MIEPAHAWLANFRLMLLPTLGSCFSFMITSSRGSIVSGWCLMAHVKALPRMTLHTRPPFALNRSGCSTSMRLRWTGIYASTMSCRHFSSRRLTTIFSFTHPAITRNSPAKFSNSGSVWRQAELGFILQAPSRFSPLAWLHLFHYGCLFLPSH